MEIRLIKHLDTGVVAAIGIVAAAETKPAVDTTAAAEVAQLSPETAFVSANVHIANMKGGLQLSFRASIQRTLPE